MEKWHCPDCGGFMSTMGHQLMFGALSDIMQFYYLATTCSTCGREQPLDGVVANFFRGNGIGPQETRENYDAKFRVLRELLNRDDPGVYGAIKARIVPVETVTGNA